MTEYTTDVADSIKDVVRSVLPSAGSISETMPWISTKLCIDCYVYSGLA